MYLIATFGIPKNAFLRASPTKFKSLSPEVHVKEHYVGQLKRRRSLTDSSMFVL